MEINNPCEECICLPTCISKYKKASGNWNFPASKLTFECSKLKAVYRGMNEVRIDTWWRHLTRKGRIKTK